MKKIYIALAAALSVLALVLACGSEETPAEKPSQQEESKSFSLGQVSAIYAPSDTTVYKVGSGLDLTLSWASVPSDSAVTYEVIVLKTKAASSPVATYSAGADSSLVLSAAQLTTLSDKFSEGSSSRSFTLYWKVRALAGGLKTVSTVSGSFKLNLPSLTAVSRPYTNPLTAESCADPSVFRAPDGSFYAFGTAPKMIRYHSTDLANWEKIDTPFNKRPQHVDGATGIWAPDMEYINGKYVLYYSQNVTMAGGNPNSTVGVAVGESLDGKFTDVGVLVQAKDFGIPGGCIDQFYWEEDGKKYLFLGSFKGIYAFELADDGLSIKDNTKPVAQIAGNAYEGGMIFKARGYYWLLASIGNCCSGKNSTYQLVVGRSANLLGPYTNMAGNPMLENNHKVILSGNSRFKGPGHCSEVFTDAAGDLWLFYHAYDMNDNDGEPTARKLMLDKITFGPKGWPNINDGYPSESGMTPVMPEVN